MRVWLENGQGGRRSNRKMGLRRMDNEGEEKTGAGKRKERGKKGTPSQAR